MSKENGKSATIVIIIVVLLVAFLIIFFNNSSNISQGSEKTVVYECGNDKTIRASFSGDIVDLSLSDGRSIVLDRESGNVYKDPDLSFAFTIDGKNASFMENNSLTYSNCREK